jgi:hypothetical protein
VPKSELRRRGVSNFTTELSAKDSTKSEFAEINKKHKNTIQSLESYN